MSEHLCLSVRFLHESFHGRADGAELEWPPSPLRLFQALVAAAASRWRDSALFPDIAAPACRWLEALGDPTIVTPPTTPGAPFRLSVPNNAMDVVAHAWARGNTSNRGDANPATHRTLKTVRPTRLHGGDVVRYLWALSDAGRGGAEPYLAVLFTAARCISALGWGVDLAVGDGQVLTQAEVDRLPGERWRPVVGPAPTRLRVPREGTLEALTARHEAFLRRLPASGGFVPVGPLTEFATVSYRRDGELASRPLAAFALLRPDAETFCVFDPVRRTPTVAGMTRHAVGQAASVLRPDEPGWVNAYVRGHGDGANEQSTTDQRFAYLPIPTLEERKSNGRTHRVVGGVRRVLVVEPPGGAGAEASWVRQRLSGRPLTDERTGLPGAVLSLLPRDDRTLCWYLAETGARAWSTVTPVILPGYDDRDRRKTEGLLRKTLGQAGVAPVLRDGAAIEWRKEGFRPGVELARRYCVSAHHEPLPRYHVRITWPTAVQGPLCLGAGRYYGMGLFAAEGLP
jgi:CRISPR-associated protein Csb2